MQETQVRIVKSITEDAAHVCIKMKRTTEVLRCRRADGADVQTVPTLQTLQLLREDAGGGGRGSGDA